MENILGLLEKVKGLSGVEKIDVSLADKITRYYKIKEEMKRLQSIITSEGRHQSVLEQQLAHMSITKEEYMSTPMVKLTFGEYQTLKCKCETLCQDMNMANKAIQESKNKVVLAEQELESLNNEYDLLVSEEEEKHIYRLCHTIHMRDDKGKLLIENPKEFCQMVPIIVFLTTATK